MRYINSRFTYLLGYDLIWRYGVVVGDFDLINEVNQHRARLVLGWVTIFRRVDHLGM